MIRDAVSIQVDSESAFNDGIQCPACHSIERHLLGCKNDYELFRCSICATIATNVNTGTEKTEEIYDHYYDRAQFEIPAVAASSLDRLVRSLANFRSTGRWLDVGYGEGGLLKIAENHGWTCYGTEVSPPSLEYGKLQGWTVAADGERDSRFPKGEFDVVTMIEFIEHVSEPDQFLRSAARWLRPGGLLYITTPNASSINRRFLGTDWSVFAPPEHLTIWSAEGLRRALSRTGFERVKVRAEGFNPHEILARLRSHDRATAPVDRNQTAQALNTAFSGSPFRRRVKDAINTCLSIAGSGDTLKAMAIRRTDTNESSNA